MQQTATHHWHTAQTAEQHIQHHNTRFMAIIQVNLDGNTTEENSSIFSLIRMR